MFNLANFVADCRSAVEADPTQMTVQEIARGAFGGDFFAAERSEWD
jgi:hypothetical protein